MNCGYVEITAKSHPNARGRGMIYEHRYIASAMLGRPLSDREVVHHIDGDRANNNKSNLMVFYSTNDHAAFHKGAQIFAINNVWHAVKTEYHCSVCGEKISTKKNSLCRDCYAKKQKSKIKPSKEELSLLILEKPMIKIGKMFGVSDNAVRKWCNSYGLPSKYNDIKKLKSV